MAATPQRIRKIETKKIIDFDDQLWPINVAILIFAGFVAGIVIAVSDFHDPRLLYNGWARLISVGLLVGLLFWAVLLLQGRMLRRVQFCILISLLVHLWLAMYLHQKYLAMMAMQENEAAQQVTEVYKQITIPDYDYHQHDQPEVKQHFEKPIETQVPKPADTDAVEHEAEEPEVPTAPEPVEEPELPQRQQPNPAMLERADLSAPRRADQAAGAQVSRQEWRHRPQPNEPIPQSEIQTPQRQVAAMPKSTLAPHEQTETQVRVQQREAFEELSSTEQQIQVAMARRATQSERQPDRPSTPTPSRQIVRPAEMPSTEAATPEPVKVARRRPERVEPKPADRMMARRQTEAPEVVRQVAEPTPQPTPDRQVTPITAPQRQRDRVPQLAEAPRPAPTKRSTAVKMPLPEANPQSDALVADTVTAQAPSSASQIRAPRRTTAAATRAPTSVAQKATDAPQQSVATAVAENTSRRASTATPMTVQRNVDRPAHIARPQNAPQIAAAQIRPEAVTAQSMPSDQPNLPTIQPSTAATARATSRSPEVPQNQPPGRALPALTREAQLPTAIAQRRDASATQEPAGAEATPSRPSSLVKQSRGAKLPSTVVASEAEPVSVPTATGGTLPSQLAQVGPSAAVRQTATQPTQGNTEAIAGAAEFAVGTTQVVARAGQPRLTGASQPTVTANARVPRIARATAPATSAAASGVVEAVPDATGAVASNRQGPVTPSFNTQASAVRRGGTVRPAAAEATPGAGPSGSSGTPAPVQVAQRVRVTRQESLASSSVTGGGTPRPSRTPGGAVSPAATAEAATVASEAPQGGRTSQAIPMMAEVNGPRRQVSGLPGDMQAAPMAGAAASLSREGTPVVEAIARRAAPATADPGQAASGIAQDVTLQRSPVGTNVPAAAVPVERLADTGPAGVAISQGAVTSTLPEASRATVRRSAANVSVGQLATSGSAESSLGAANVVAMAGQVRSTAQSLPNPTASAATREIGRQASAGPAIAMQGPLDAEPTAESEAGGPTTEPGSVLPPSTAMASNAAATEGRTGIADDQPIQVEEIPEGAAGGGTVAMAEARKFNRDETTLAAAPAGALAAPRRRLGTLSTPGVGTAAPEVAEAGPVPSGAEAAPEVAFQAGLTGPQREYAGLPGELIDRTAIDAARQAGPSATTPGTAIGQRRLPQGDQSGPSIAAEVGSGPLRKTSSPGLPRGLAAEVDEQPVAVASAAEAGDALVMAEGVGLGDPARQAGGLPVQIAAAVGPGGLSTNPSPEIGIPSRRARPESEIVHAIARRFVVERSGGRLAIDGRVNEPTDAYRHRDRGRRAQIMQGEGGPTASTERAVEMGLDFFARHQFPDGHWSLDKLPPGLEYEDPELGQYKSDTAATGLALLTYLGAGYTHLDDKHRAVVNRGIDWLIRHQQEDGDLFTPNGGSRYAWLYSHAIASIALCEAYGMTQDPELREPAARAIDFIIKAQHATKGGWRYEPRRETDTSVSGWMLMALKSAQMAGLEVPQEVFAKVGHWLDLAKSTKEQGRYAYNPYAANTLEQREGRQPSLAMTSEAMLMRMYLGKRNNASELVLGANYLMENLPDVGTRSRPTRDTYYWYYATQAMFQMRGDYWTAWNDRLRPLAESSQDQFGPAAGSWHPKKPVPDRWGHAGGRLYVTAMHLLMLEVYYRHLPLFQELDQ